jgi:hypothetical protein
VTEISLGHHAGQSFWVVEFVRSSFALLCGPTLSDAPAMNLEEVVRAYFKTSAYRDLRQEEVGRHRLKLAKKYVLSKALLGQNRAVLRHQLPPEVSLGITELDVREAIASLVESDLLETAPGLIAIKDIDQDLRRRLELIKTLIDEQALLFLLGTPEWLGIRAGYLASRTFAANSRYSCGSAPVGGLGHCTGGT